MYHSLILSILMLLCTVLFDINFAQTTCGSACHCDCDNVTRTLDCNSLEISTFTVCGSLDNYQRVNFTNNNITELETRVTGCSYDFSHNQIRSVEISWQSYFALCDSFLLNLSHNVLRRFSEGAIDLEYYIDLYYYYYYYSFEYTGLIVIDLSFNEIEYLEHDSIAIRDIRAREPFTRMTIDLSFNNLLSIHPSAINIDYLSDMYLSLNNNHLSNFTVSSIVDNVRYVDGYYLINLQNNNITGFQEEDIENVFHEVHLILDGNPWNCDCGQRYVSLNTSRLQRFLSNNNSVQPICELPYFVRGHPLLSLSADELVCVPKLDQNANLNIQVIAGDTLTLFCPVTGADPPITDVDWQIPVGSSVQGEKTSFVHVRICFNCSLIINNIQNVLEGVYQCTVSNGESLTIKQEVMVENVITSSADVYAITSPSSPTSPMESRDSTIAAAKRPLLIAVIFISVLLIIVVVSLTVVSYKQYKPKTNEIPLPQKCKTETSQNAPGFPRYDVNVENKAFDDNQDDYEVPKEEKGQGYEEEEDIYEINDINGT